MKDNLPHIAFEYPDNFPENFGDLFSKGIENEDLDLRIKKNEQTLWAASEWVIPGLIAVYVFKPYFESFLKEAGKDHYLLLKKKIKEVLSKTKNMEVTTLTSSGTTKKVDNSNTQSKAISVFLQSEKDILIKLLYDNKLDLETWHSSTEFIMNVLEEHYENKPNNQITEYLEKIDLQRGRTIYAIIDPETKNWTFINNLGEYEREKRNKN